MMNQVTRYANKRKTRSDKGKRKAYTNKTLVKDYLTRYQNTKYFSIKTICFDKFNTKNSIDKQWFAMKNRLDLNDFRRTDLVIIAYRYKGMVLHLSDELLDMVHEELGVDVLDEYHLYLD